MGIYTAPNSVPNPNKVTVTATSAADTTKSGSADLTIAPLQMSYGYDENGERVFSSNGTTTTLYPTKLYNTDGTTPTKHIFANGEVIATVQGSGTSATTHIVATDHLTGSNVISDMSGNIQEVMDYYPFGATRLDEHQGFSEQRKFAGHEFDQDTGLAYMDARYYQPNTGRFLGEDPLFRELGDRDIVTNITGRDLPTVLTDPQMLNSYTYARNNPIKFSDPTGQAVGVDDLIFIAIAGLFVPTRLDADPQYEPMLSTATQSQSGAQKPPQPPPTGPDGEPTPPPVSVPGAPKGTQWKWNPDQQNPRGGTWGPDNWKGPNPPRGSWDPNGHWDVDEGGKQPRKHYGPDGQPLTPEDVHPGNAPTQQTMTDKTKSTTRSPIFTWGTVGAAAYFIIDVASRIIIPPRNLVPVP